MYGVLQILVSTPARRRLLGVAASALLLSACGQKGPLFLPSGAAAQGRATLPESLQPAPSTAVVPATAASSIPPTGTASPVRDR
jgi:predicted small lipoprotein YifL